MFEMFGGKTVSRKPKNAAITSNNRRKSRGVSTKARSKLAPKKSTKRTRRGRKHGGRASTNNKPTENFPAMTENVVEEIKENNLKTAPEVADMMKEEILKNKSAKEKANILNGIARHVGKNPRIYGGTTILLAIFIIAYQSNLIGFMATKVTELWDSIFTSVPSAVRKPAREVAEAFEDAETARKVAEAAHKAAHKAAANAGRTAQSLIDNNLINAQSAATEAASTAKTAAEAAEKYKKAATEAYKLVKAALTKLEQAMNDAKNNNAARNVLLKKQVDHAAAKVIADQAEKDNAAAAAAAAAADAAATAATAYATAADTRTHAADTRSVAAAEAAFIAAAAAEAAAAAADAAADAARQQTPVVTKIW